MNTGAKYLGAYLPTAQIVWARTLTHLLFVIGLFAPTHGGWRLFVTRKPTIQIGRSLCLVTSTSFFFTALGHVPLADATAVTFTSPLIVAGLAGPILGERVDRRHWAAIAVGFLGALVVIRPTGAGTNPWIFLVFGNATTYAVYQILTRRVGAWDRPETSVTYSALVGAVLLSLGAPLFWRTPEQLGHWVLLGALGLFGGLGHYCVARGLLWGPASILSPFHYAQLISAAVAGYLVFGHVPSAWTWLGAMLIVASGLSIASREARRR